MRRRLSGRGAATLALAIGAVVVGGLWLSLGMSSAREGVGAATGKPADTAPRVASTRDVPDSLFERLPVTDRVLDLSVTSNETGAQRFSETLSLGSAADPVSLRVNYTFDPELTREVFGVLNRGRVSLGHVILVDPRTGRVLAYASTDTERFPPTRLYPAASLVKIITAAAALDRDPKLAELPCRYRGSPYRLTRARIDPPRNGVEVSLRKALASSNNQCFAQLAVHAVGGNSMLDAIGRFGWLSAPGPAHAAGTADPGEDRYGVGQLGSGLAGSRITPLHAAQLASTLARGELVAPRWIESVHDGRGRELPLLAVDPPRQVMTSALTVQLRDMLVDTTSKGTARRAFRKRNGRPMLGPVRVAGKTGSLSGKDPTGRYEWFAGVAPAHEPTVAVAVLLVQSELWWRNASQIAAEVLRKVFCSKDGCRPDLAARWVSGPSRTAGQVVRVHSVSRVN
jgi:membrane peptidoglycan carboxypeptidase